MKLSWEPFDPERFGYEALSRWLTELYAGPPWNEYRKCFNCSGAADFGPKALYGRPEAKATTRCLDCGAELQPFWSPARVREHLEQLQCKGELLGFTVLCGGERAAWVWGYEIRPETPAPWGRAFEGLGMYGDRIVVLPQFRNGIVLWYLLLTTLIDLKRTGHSYIIARTHVEATNVRTMLTRLRFEEIAECPLLPQRSYWLRSLVGSSDVAK